jgi:hypothetical protein
MNKTHRWASILLGSTMLSASAKTILLDVRPGKNGGSPTSTAADFQAYDPVVSLSVTPDFVTTFGAIQNKVLTDEDAANYTITTSGEAALEYNAGGVSWNDTTPIVSGYCYKNSDVATTFTVTGVDQFPAGEIITLTVFGVGDNANQGGKFIPTYAGATLAAKTTTAGTDQAVETGSVRSAQWQFTSDGTTTSLSFTWERIVAGTSTAIFNGFSITSAPPSFGEVTSATMTPETITRIIGAPATQLSVSADFSVAGTLDVTALGVTGYGSDNTSVATVSASGLVETGMVGTATVTATVTGDTTSEADTTLVTVDAPTLLTITAPETTLLADGYTTNLDTTAESANLSGVAVEGYTGFSYSSNNSSVADVDPDTGVVTPGNSAGVATITASLGGATGTVDITVEEATSITATVLTNDLYIGGAGVTVNVTASSTSFTDLPINGLAALYFDSDDFDIAAVGTASGAVTPGTFTGTANITAFFGAVDDTLAINVADVPSKPNTLIHRYSFSNTAGAATAGSTITDSVGTAHGTVVGLGGTFTGTELTLPGGVEADDTTYVNLPNGIVSTIPSVDTTGITFEVWMTHNDTTPWTRAFDFGNNENGEDMTGFQTSTIDLIPRRTGSPGNIWTEFTLNRTLYGTVELVGNTALTTGVQAQIVVTIDSQTGNRKMYKDGGLIGSGLIAFNNNKVSLVDDVNCWLGRSNAGDPRLNGSLDEFRIYTGIMTESEVAANYALGPDLLPGAGQPYSAWSGLYADNEPADGDFDKDGVSNGVEYFMGETNSPVFTSNPGIVGGKVTWPKSSDFIGTYTVETSPDLATWTPRASTVVGNTVEYLVTTDPNERFIRLKVTP